MDFTIKDNAFGLIPIPKSNSINLFRLLRIVFLGHRGYAGGAGHGTGRGWLCGMCGVCDGVWHAGCGRVWHVQYV